MHIGDLGIGEEVWFGFFFFEETNASYSVFSGNRHYQHSYYNMLRLLFFPKSQETAISFPLNNATFTRASGL